MGAQLQGSDRLARWLALIVPAALLAGAYISQYVFGLYPCEMCWWQRYPHFAAVALALLAFLGPAKKFWIALAAAAIMISGFIGVYHAGVEYGWWEGVSACTGVEAEGATALEAIMNTPLVRCDEAPWTLLGISLAGFNALISVTAGLAIFRLLGLDRKG